jgi:hypothetical protein
MNPYIQDHLQLVLFYCHWCTGVRSGCLSGAQPLTPGTFFPLGPGDAADSPGSAFPGDRSAFMLNPRGGKSFNSRATPTPLASAGVGDVTPERLQKQ